MVRQLSTGDRRRRGRIAGLSASALPVCVATAQPAASEADAFGPCKWETAGKGKSARRVLACPDSKGVFSRESASGVSEETPARADQGDVAAMLLLARFYDSGPKAVRSPERTFAWSTKAAEQGSPGGAFNLGLAFETGSGTAVDRAAAKRWYRAAAEKNYPAAMVNLAGSLLATPGDASALGEASALLNRAAEAGSVAARFNLGYLSENGLGTPRDMAAAIRFYGLAADKGSRVAMARLAFIHADGIGVPVDQKEAARWLVASSDTSIALINMLGYMTLFALHMDDPGRRKEAVQRAVANPLLAVQFGLLLIEPEFPSRDPELAVKLFRVAADAHLPAASLCLARAYATGAGVPKDDAEAIKWFRIYMRAEETAQFQRVTSLADPKQG